VEPRFSLISVGRNNRFMHPAEETIEKLRHQGSIVHRTDLSGAAVIQSDGKELHVLR